MKKTNKDNENETTALISFIDSVIIKIKQVFRYINKAIEI